MNGSCKGILKRKSGVRILFEIIASCTQATTALNETEVRTKGNGAYGARLYALAAQYCFKGVYIDT